MTRNDKLFWSIPIAVFTITGIVFYFAINLSLSEVEEAEKQCALKGMTAIYSSRQSGKQTYFTRFCRDVNGVVYSF